MENERMNKYQAELKKIKLEQSKSLKEVENL